MDAVHDIATALYLGTIPALWAYEALKKSSRSKALHADRLVNTHPFQEEVR